MKLIIAYDQGDVLSPVLFCDFIKAIPVSYWLSDDNTLFLDALNLWFPALNNESITCIYAEVIALKKEVEFFAKTVPLHLFQDSVIRVIHDNKLIWDFTYKAPRLGITTNADKQFC